MNKFLIFLKTIFTWTKKGVIEIVEHLDYSEEDIKKLEKAVEIAKSKLKIKIKNESDK